MKVLFIGGTGNISTAVSELAISRGIELYHLNRGHSVTTLTGINTLMADINDPAQVRSVVDGHSWDVVVNWIAFNADDVKRDIKLFSGKTRQYIFISSASCYQKPSINPIITESTPLKNPFWDYSRNKIAAEEALLEEFRNKDFPVTIVRPSLTYDNVIPIPIGGFRQFTTANRMLQGKKIIIPGDGTSVWTVTHARDFAKGFVGLLGNTKVIGESFHITSDELLTWNGIFQMVADALNVELDPVHIASDYICEKAPEFTGTLLGDKSVSTIFDNSKIRHFVPDFKATIPFSVGIKGTIEWFNAHPESRIIDQKTNQCIDEIIDGYLGK